MVFGPSAAHRGVMGRLRTVVVVAVCALLPLLGATPAPALALGGGGDGDARGDCSRRSEWRLKTDYHDGRIEVEGKVRTGVNGQRWHWRILHNGDTSFHGARRTQSGRFRVERDLINAPGLDRIGWRASNGRTGERCRGGLTF